MTESYSTGFTEQVLLPIADNFFNASITGSLEFLKEHLGARPVIFVGNHAGASLSWDNIIFDAILWRATKHALGEPVKLHRLVHSRLYGGSVSPYLLPDWWERMECVECTSDNFDDLCQDNAVIHISPEGISGLAKGHRRANELMPFSSSVVQMAKKHDAIIVPVTIANSAYLNPYSVTMQWLNRAADKLFGWPFLPVSPILWMALFPRFFIIPMPAQLKYHIHEPWPVSGPNNLEINRHDAERLRRYMESSLEEENDLRKKALPLLQAIRSIVSGRPFANPMTHYRAFWEFELNRRLSWLERAYFSMPIAGYALVRAWQSKRATVGVQAPSRQSACETHETTVEGVV